MRVRNMFSRDLFTGEENKVSQHELDILAAELRMACHVIAKQEQINLQRNTSVEEMFFARRNVAMN